MTKSEKMLKNYKKVSKKNEHYRELKTIETLINYAVKEMRHMEIPACEIEKNTIMNYQEIKFLGEGFIPCSFGFNKKKQFIFRVWVGNTYECGMNKKDFWKLYERLGKEYFETLIKKVFKG